MWILFSILTALCYVLANYVLKYSVEKNVRDADGVVFYHALTACIISLLVWGVFSRETMLLKHAAVAISSGLLVGAGAVGYIKIVTMESTSATVILNRMTGPILFLMSISLLHESFKPLHVVGMLVTLAAVIYAQLEHGTFRIRRPTSVIIMLSCCVAWAFSFVLTRKVAPLYQSVTYNMLQNVGYLIFATIFSFGLPKYRRHTMKNLRPFTWRIPLVIASSEVIFVAAVTSEIQAIRLKTPALVSVVTSSEVVIAIFVGWTLTKLLPKLIKEDISRGVLMQKIIGALGVIAGITITALA